VHGFATLRAEGAGTGLLTDPEVPEGVLALVVAACAATLGSGAAATTMPELRKSSGPAERS
jgi:hypothetical protein